jgi:hypothetical protein
MSQQQRQPVRQEWPGFFAVITRDERGKPVTIEIVSPEIGTKVEASEVPLEAITYDDRDDAVIVEVSSSTGEEGALRHIVSNPWKIIFDPPSPGSVRSMDIEGSDGAHTLVTLHGRPDAPGAG